MDSDRFAKSKTFVKTTVLIQVLLVFVAIINTRNYHRSMRTLTQSEFQELHRLYADKTTTSARSELVPKWASTERWKPEDPNLYGDFIAKYKGGIHFASSDQAPGNIKFTASAENNRSVIRIYQNYFPSWKATIDGKNTSIKPSETGEILIQTKQGEHEYHVWVGQTLLEQVSNIITLITAMYLAYLMGLQYGTKIIK